MPHKFNGRCRDKFPTAKFRVINWPDNYEALRERGDLTFWIEESSAKKWYAPKRKGRGGQTKYSDFAIQTCLTLGPIFH